MAAFSALMLSLNLTAASREVSYAIEDAAYQALTKMAEDPRVAKEVKKLAFVKLWLPSDDGGALSNASTETAVFESALGSIPCGFDIVLHSNRDQQWGMIDQVFDQASDFESYNPVTHPELQKLELCDSLLLAKIIDADAEAGGKVATVRLAVKIIQVKTSRQIWSAVLEGRYDGRSAPENEALSYFARKALESAASDAVSKLPASLEGYGVMIVPLQGNGGRAMTQIFMNALTAAGKQDKIRIYDLPNGNASDRMLGRYLWERTGSGKPLDPSVLKKIQERTGIKGKLAVMSGMVASGRVFPETWVDPTGAPVDLLTGSYTDVRKNPTSLEIIADLKFRDVCDAFRVVAAVSANGIYKSDISGDLLEQARSFVTVRNIVLLVVILLVVWFVGRYTFRVR